MKIKITFLWKKYSMNLALSRFFWPVRDETTSWEKKSFKNVRRGWGMFFLSCHNNKKIEEVLWVFRKFLLSIYHTKSVIKLLKKKINETFLNANKDVFPSEKKHMARYLINHQIIVDLVEAFNIVPNMT